MAYRLARVAALVLPVFLLSLPMAAKAEEAPASNQIVLSQQVVGQAPEGTVFSFYVQCIAFNEPPGEGVQLPGVSVVDQTVTFGATGNPPDLVIDVPAITDRDDGFVLCGINPDLARLGVAHLLTPQTVVVTNPGTSRAADPQSDPVVGGPIGDPVGVQFPFTRAGAVVHVTFTNTYPEPQPPVLLYPNFTG